MPVAVGRIPGWVFIGLCFGTSVLAETDPEFSECSQSFYKQTPPAGFLEGQLQPRCHSLGAGQSFANFHSTSCDSTILSAFCLDKAWRGTARHSQEEDGAGTDTEDAQTGTEEKDPKSQIDEKDLPATMPALLRRDGYNVYTSSDTLANSWDALLSELVQNNVHPQCRSLGGDLYVLTGTGAVGELGQGCEVGLFWSAMCCAVPNEEAVFSVAVVKMREEEEARVLDVKGLEEIAGVGGVFLGGCGEADGGGVITLALFQNAVQQIIETHNTDTQSDSSDKQAESATQSDSSDTQAESATQSDSSDTQAESAAQSDSSDTQAESATQSDSSDTQAESATQSDSSDTLADSTAAESTDAPSEEAEGGSAVVKSRRSVPLGAHEESSTRTSQAADTPRAEPSGNSTLRYLLSCSLWLVSTPFRPITSTLTQMPGQLSHVIWEDLSVLSTLPGVTFSLLYNVVADVAWGGVSAVGLAGKMGAVCVSKLYSCTSPLVTTLLCTCQDGVMGVGTLTWDGVGIFGGAVNRAWSVSRYVGGRAWEQSEGFLWAVLSELGSQSKGVGGGLGKLVLKGGKGVANVVCMAGRIVGGTLTLAVEGVKKAFGDD